MTASNEHDTPAPAGNGSAGGASTSTAGTPARAGGTPTASTQATGTPATGTPATGTPATGTPAGGAPAPAPAGQGRLAQVIATRGGLAPPEAPFVIEHREALIYMLCEAAELEHGIMCQYLFAAFSIKQAEGEGLTEAELAAARRWRKVITHVATQEMLHLALVQNLLSAIGAAPHMSRPNLPAPASHYPAGVKLALLPFGEQALRHFMFLERPEGMDLRDADGLTAMGQAVPVMEAGDIVPRGQDFQTVGHLYRSIEAGFARLTEKYGERWLFVGPPRAQATQEHFGWPQLVPVTDLPSAQRAIEEILEQGEGPRGDWQDAHFGQFVKLLDEFVQARVANDGIAPVRPVVPVNVRPSERDPDIPLVTDPDTARVMDLFNVAYEILLQIFERFFAHTDETDAQLKALADATMDLMFRVIAPLGDLITTLPAGPDYPGATAGPSFELFYESDYLLPHREAAWALLIERIDTAAAFCQPIAGEAGAKVTAALEPIRAALNDIGQALAAHLPAGDAHSRPASPALTAGDLQRLRGRALEFGRNRSAAEADGTVTPDLAVVFDAAHAITSRLLRAVPEDAAVAWAAPRLVNSVLRPLADALRRPTAARSSGQAAPATDGGERAPASDGGERAPATDGRERAPQADRGGRAAQADGGEMATPAGGGDVAELVRQAALTATRQLVRLHRAGGSPPELPEVAEATAALQDLAVRLAPGPDRAAALIAELWELQSALPARIQTARNGPYLATSVPNVFNYLGVRQDLPPQLALCRCGASASKPFCDGTHASNGFSEAKDPERVPDRRDTYHGEQVTIFDNRGICQHSGFCTDRLATAFRTSQEPFVAPSGGRMDEIVRAVRDCPSGALGLAFDDQEARDLADWHGTREPAIEITKDGPYRITGGVALADADGADVARAEGASREHCALCRCGESRNKPFCSGAHWYAGFSDPVPAPGVAPSLFEWAGGLPALTRMTRLLYEKHVPADLLLAPLFAGLPSGYPRREAQWIGAAFGGPGPDGPDGSATHPGSGGPGGSAPRAGSGGSGRSDRDGLALGQVSEEQRARWVALATRAADEAGLPDDAQFRAALTAFFEWDSRNALGQPPGVRWDWTPAGPPDTLATSADETTGPEEAQVTLPGPGEPVSYASTIKPLFRERDRQSMLRAFDLWSHDDVQAHATAILARLSDGSMPCDGAWPAEQVEVFRRWTETGFPP